jgi:hypothetical protein
MPSTHTAALLQELDQEGQTTRRLLERVPDDRLAWKPHAKARTLGELALHVATVPGLVASFACEPSPVQVPPLRPNCCPRSTAVSTPPGRESVPSTTPPSLRRGA